MDFKSSEMPYFRAFLMKSHILCKKNKKFIKKGVAKDRGVCYIRFHREEHR